MRLMSGATRDRSTRPNPHLFQISDYVNKFVSHVLFWGSLDGTRSGGRPVTTYVDLIGEMEPPTTAILFSGVHLSKTPKSHLHKHELLILHLVVILRCL